MSTKEIEVAREQVESCISSHMKDEAWHYATEYFRLYGADSSAFTLNCLLRSHLKCCQQDETMVFDEEDIARVNNLIVFITQLETLGNAMRGMQRKIVMSEIIRRNHQVLS